MPLGLAGASLVTFCQAVLDFSTSHHQSPRRLAHVCCHDLYRSNAEMMNQKKRLAHVLVDPKKYELGFPVSVGVAGVAGAADSV